MYEKFEAVNPLTMGDTILSMGIYSFTTRNAKPMFPNLNLNNLLLSRIVNFFCRNRILMDRIIHTNNITWIPFIKLTTTTISRNDDWMIGSFPLDSHNLSAFCVIITVPNSSQEPFTRVMFIIQITTQFSWWTTIRFAIHGGDPE